MGQIEHACYLLAYDPSRKGMRTFALQRITQLRVLKSKFDRDPRFNARDHLGGGFGVWNYDGKANQVHEIRLQFEDYPARVVSNRLSHSSQAIQKLEPDDSVIELQVTLSGFEEITRWILSWGSKAKVLGPSELAKRVKDEIEKMADANAPLQRIPQRTLRLNVERGPSWR